MNKPPAKADTEIAPEASSSRGEWEIPWRTAWGASARWLLAGAALMAAGAVWLAATSANPMDAASDQRNAATAPVGLLVLPGLICIGLGLRIAVRTRALLATGVATAAEIDYLQPLRLRWPEQFQVGFRYRDATGASHASTQRVPANSVLGQELWRARGAAVRYDQKRPAVGLLVPTAAPCDAPAG